MGLERGDGPLYVQIRDAIRQQIDGQSLPPGAPLPTEDELQATYGVSRSVVRQALGQLADWGLIVRQRGRGSVVAPQREHHRRANQAGGLRQQLADSGVQLCASEPYLQRLQASAEGLSIGSLADKLGTLSGGKLADIVGVAGNPLTELKTTEHPVFVMKEGVIYVGAPAAH